MSYTCPRSETACHISADQSQSDVKRLVLIKLIVLPLVFAGRFYQLHQGGERQFAHELAAPRFPPDWEGQKAYALTFRRVAPRNTLVRMAYADALVDRSRLRDAERELWLASIDSSAVEATLGRGKIIVFLALASVQLREHKKAEALATIAKGCGREAVDTSEAIDWLRPCGAGV